MKKFFGSLKMPSYKMAIDPKSYRLAHPIWSLKEAENVEVTHHVPKGVRDYLAFGVMKMLRVSFDILSKYKPGHMSETLYLRRFIFLETVAGVPGMVGGMVRHLRSLGSLQQDGGWIHHLLEEAENERMHLFTFLGQKSPGILFRLAILSTQALFLTGYSLMYMLSPRFCHRFVGYLEEEAVKTYTNCLKELDEGKLPHWTNMPAGMEAKMYWGLPEDAKFRDVLLAVRADELMHREVNHHLATLRADDKFHLGEYHITRDPIGEALRFENPKVVDAKDISEENKKL